MSVNSAGTGTAATNTPDFKNMLSLDVSGLVSHLSSSHQALSQHGFLLESYQRALAHNNNTMNELCSEVEKIKRDSADKQKEIDALKRQVAGTASLYNELRNDVVSYRQDLRKLKDDVQQHDMLVEKQQDAMQKDVDALKASQDVTNSINDEKVKIITDIQQLQFDFAQLQLENQQFIQYIRKQLPHIKHDASKPATLGSSTATTPKLSAPSLSKISDKKFALDKAQPAAAHASAQNNNNNTDNNSSNNAQENSNTNSNTTSTAPSPLPSPVSNDTASEASTSNNNNNNNDDIKSTTADAAETANTTTTTTNAETSNDTATTNNELVSVLTTSPALSSPAASSPVPAPDVAVHTCHFTDAHVEFINALSQRIDQLYHVQQQMQTQHDLDKQQLLQQQQQQQQQQLQPQQTLKVPSRSASPSPPASGGASNSLVSLPCNTCTSTAAVYCKECRSRFCAACDIRVHTSEDESLHERLSLHGLPSTSRFLAPDLTALHSNSIAREMSDVLASVALLNSRIDRSDSQFSTLIRPLGQMENLIHRVNDMGTQIIQVKKDALEMNNRVGAITNTLMTQRPTYARSTSSSTSTSSPATSGAAPPNDDHAETIRALDLRVAVVEGRLNALDTVEIKAITKDVAELKIAKAEQSEMSQLLLEVQSCESQLRHLHQVSNTQNKSLNKHMNEWDDFLSVASCQHCTSHVPTLFKCVLCTRRICDDCEQGDHRADRGNSTGTAIMQQNTLQQIQTIIQHIQTQQTRDEEELHMCNARLEELFRKFEHDHDEHEHDHDIVASLQSAADSQHSTTSAVTTLRPNKRIDRKAVQVLQQVQQAQAQVQNDQRVKLSQLEHMCSAISDSLVMLERRNREMEIATRPWVDERSREIYQRMADNEKEQRKKVKGELRKFQEEVLARLIMTKEEMSGTTSLGKVHFRCLACDQVVLTQTGPESKMWHSQHAHTHTHVQSLSSTQQSVVGGFASLPQPLSGSQSARPSTVAHVPFNTTLSTVAPSPTAASTATATNTSSLSHSQAIHSSSPSPLPHIYIAPGAVATVIGSDGRTYAGREESKVDFVPAHTTDGRNASFHTQYASHAASQQSFNDAKVERSAGRSPERNSQRDSHISLASLSSTTTTNPNNNTVASSTPTPHPPSVQLPKINTSQNSSREGAGVSRRRGRRYDNNDDGTAE